VIAALQLSVRAALAAGISVAIAARLALPFPIYAMIAAVIVTDLSPQRTRQQALPRMAGTVVGACIGAAASELLPWSPWSIALGIGLAMFTCEIARMKDATKLAGYVSGIVLLVEHGGEPWLYAWQRLLETALGVAIAVLVSLVPKLLHAEPPPAPR
jgi:uncharacterized membrane protein YgaE (UPF0421/DUF939 family)